MHDYCRISGVKGEDEYRYNLKGASVFKAFRVALVQQIPVDRSPLALVLKEEKKR